MDEYKSPNNCYNFWKHGHFAVEYKSQQSFNVLEYKPSLKFEKFNKYKVKYRKLKSPTKGSKKKSKVISNLTSI